MSVKSYPSREVLQILRKDGWIVKGREDSHVQLIHPIKPGKVTVKHPKKDLKRKTVKSIFKQTGLKIE